MTGIVSPSTVLIEHRIRGRHSSKTVNIDFVKPEPEDVVGHTADGAILANAAELEFDSSSGSGESSSDSEANIGAEVIGGHALRCGARLQQPGRYRFKVFFLFFS